MAVGVSVFYIFRLYKWHEYVLIMQFAPRAINFAYYAGIMLDAFAPPFCTPIMLKTKNYAGIIDAGLIPVANFKAST